MRARILVKYSSDEINWKGIGDYLSAARTLAAHGSSNTSGPQIHCQGLALELAFKFYLWDKTGTYPLIHDLEALATDHCQDIQFTANELASIQQLNRQYIKDGEFPYPSRYRPRAMRVVTSMAPSTLADLIAKAIRSSSRSDLVDRILSR
jgi:HEPN domain-containing protein